MQGEIDSAFVTIENFVNEDQKTAKDKKISYIRLYDAVQIVRAEAEKHGKTTEVYFLARFSELKGARILEQFQSRFASHTNRPSEQLTFAVIFQIIAELASQERKA